MMTTAIGVKGSMRDQDGTGTVRMQDRYDTNIDDLWSALTEPGRLARWIAEVKGDLRLGGTFYARFTSSWEGPGRVDVCDAPRRLVLTMNPDQPDQTVIEAWLAADGAQTSLMIEERGLPLEDLPAHGAGWQAHVEDLAAYLAGREPADWRTRWVELTPPYEELSERASLMRFLRAQRRSVLAIIEGIGEDRLRQPAAPSGWTPLGLIEHLAHAERSWFQLVLTGHADPLPWPPEGRGGSFTTTHPVSEVLDFYHRQCAASDEALARSALTAAPEGQVPDGLVISGDIHTTRDIVLHMIEETARHAGHLDLAREHIDGRTGLGPR